MFEVVWGLVAPVLGLVAVLRARSWAERSVAAEERFFGDRLRDGQRRRRLVFATTINVVVGSAIVMLAGSWWAGLVEFGQGQPAPGPEPAAALSWLAPVIFAVWGAAAVFIVVMLVLRFRQARRFRRGEVDGGSPTEPRRK